MSKYKYTAVDLYNKKVSDVMDARDDIDFRKKMRAMNLVPVKYNVMQDKLAGYRLKANEAAEFSRQVASMLGSGITLVRVMEILKDRNFKPRLKAVYERLHRDVQQGLTLSEAMRLQSKAFPELLVNMYASGEVSGQLEKVADKMATHFEKDHRLNGKVKSAMTYPMILLVVTIVVVLLIFIGIMPEFFVAFGDMELPAITKAMVGISQFLQVYWYMLIIGVLILIAIYQYVSRYEKVAIKIGLFKLRFPVFGPLLKIVYTARFSRTLSSLYSSGISMINALEITATIIGNKYIENQFEEVIKNVRNGEYLSTTVGAVDGFDGKLATTILIGEESGRLDTMLVSTADAFDYEAEAATMRMVQLIEPVMLVTMAVVIGGIMLSVMMPLMSMYQDVGNM